MLVKGCITHKVFARGTSLNFFRLWVFSNTDDRTILFEISSIFPTGIAKSYYHSNVPLGCYVFVVVAVYWHFDILIQRIRLASIYHSIIHIPEIFSVAKCALGLMPRGTTGFGYMNKILSCCVTSPNAFRLSLLGYSFAECVHYKSIIYKLYIRERNICRIMQ